MIRIVDRYATAVRTSNLRSKPETAQSDSDVVGAFGFAGSKTRGAESDDPRPGAPLATALQRLFTGDNRAADEIDDILSQGVVTRAWRTTEMKLSMVEAQDMARAVLAWHRHGRCRACNGHGFKLIPGAPSLGGEKCTACNGTTRMPFDSAFALEVLDLAQWMLREVDREMSIAGPAAMAALAPRLQV